MTNYSDEHNKAKLKIKKMDTIILDRERKNYNATYKRIALNELKARGYIKKKPVVKKDMFGMSGYKFPKFRF